MRSIDEDQESIECPCLIRSNPLDPFPLVQRPEERIETGVQIRLEINRQLATGSTCVNAAEGVPGRSGQGCRGLGRNHLAHRAEAAQWRRPAIVNTRTFTLAYVAAAGSRALRSSLVLSGWGVRV